MCRISIIISSSGGVLRRWNYPYPRKILCFLVWIIERLFGSGRSSTVGEIESICLAESVLLPLRTLQRCLGASYTRTHSKISGNVSEARLSSL